MEVLTIEDRFGVTEFLDGFTREFGGLIMDGVSDTGDNFLFFSGLFFSKGSEDSLAGEDFAFEVMGDEVGEGFIDGEVKKKVDVGIEV